jgi:hypothetical protein
VASASTSANPRCGELELGGAKLASGACRVVGRSVRSSRSQASCSQLRADFCRAGKKGREGTLSIRGRGRKYLQSGRNQRTFAADVRVGERILLDNGLLERSREQGDTEITTRVVLVGPLQSNKGINLSGVEASVPRLASRAVFGMRDASSLCWVLPRCTATEWTLRTVPPLDIGKALTFGRGRDALRAGFEYLRQARTPRPWAPRAGLSSFGCDRPGRRTRSRGVRARRRTRA